MDIARIYEFLHRQPFHPFEIRMANGYIYEVDHPEFLSPSRDGKAVSFWTAEDGRLVILATSQINSLELKNVTTAA